MMNHLVGTGLILIYFVHLASGARNCKLEPRCTISKIHGMKVADCYQKELRSIPQCVMDDVEIINLSYNRIRKINKDDLKRYSYLKILYLSDNMVNTINEEAFNDLTDLATIDLTLNAVQTLPPVIFQLPSLKTLYLGQNLNINIVEAIESAKPINIPLWHLDISFLTDIEPIEFPDFGIMPNLIRLNITGNTYDDLTPKHFAGLCNLKYLVNANVSVDFTKECDCWLINKWLLQRKVQFTTFQCVHASEDCGIKNLDQDDLKTFEQCHETVKTLAVHSHLTKILTIVGCCVVVVLILIAIYLFFHRKPQRRAASQQVVELKKDSVNLLCQEQ